MIKPSTRWTFFSVCSFTVFYANMISCTVRKSTLSWAFSKAQLFQPWNNHFWCIVDNQQASKTLFWWGLTYLKLRSIVRHISAWLSEERRKLFLIMRILCCRKRPSPTRGWSMSNEKITCLKLLRKKEKGRWNEIHQLLPFAGGFPRGRFSLKKNRREKINAFRSCLLNPLTHSQIRSLSLTSREFVGEKRHVCDMGVREISS